MGPSFTFTLHFLLRTSLAVHLSATEVGVLMSNADYMGSPGKRRPKRSTSPGTL
jgi:hypothetical protein